LFTDTILLKDLVQKLNTRVMESANGEKFITLFIAKYNKNTKELTYVNAGHNPPFVFDKIENEITYLKDGCPGMGMLDDLPMVRVGKINIKNNTKLLCYTDGLVELRGELNTDAGMESVAQYLKTDSRIDQTLNTLIEELDITRNNKLFFDDISMLGIEFLLE
jgi:sigma-B regulation protein RsbU (phosphoserine phosphatase)